MSLRPLALMFATVLACAQEGVPAATILAHESVGEAVRNGQNTDLHANQPISSGTHLARIDLANGAKGFILMAADTRVRLDSVMNDGKPSLRILVEAGKIEVNLDARGPYQDVHVLGSCIDVRVTGTLFLVERMPHDQDYIAVIHGHVSVHLRSDVTTQVAAGARDHVDLDDHQGLIGGPDGLGGKTDALSSRPQLSGTTSSLHDQGIGLGGGLDWDSDSALALTTSEQHSFFQTGTDVSDTISQQVADTVTHNINAQITGEVINQTIGGSPAFGAPPSPP